MRSLAVEIAWQWLIHLSSSRLIHSHEEGYGKESRQARNVGP
jgi:hypothetical protein